MRTGIATVPLDYGKCPKWLFERMKRLSRGIMLAIAQDFGTEEIIKRLSNPTWFQSFGATLAFDWNSSGLTTVLMGALKESLKGLEKDIGFFVCGGKRISRRTPEEIQKWGEILGWRENKAQKLIYASKMAAKVDSALIQNPQAPFQLYHHNFIFTKNGQWVVVQQAMSPIMQKARRYHWYSSGLQDFTQEPHSAVVSDIRLKPLNLTAGESRENKEISTELVKEEPKTFLKDIKLISESTAVPRRSPRYSVSQNALMKQKRLANFTEMELNDVEFHWHPVVQEKFDLKRLEKTIFFAKSQEPKNFEQLLALKGVGPKTIRALSLVSELIYGANPSYEDPARYSFTVGGKDGTPEPVDRKRYDALLYLMEKGIQKSQISLSEKAAAQRRLESLNP